MGEPLPEFDPEFADPAQWAAMYRACGWPVVPAWMPAEMKPAERKNFKHPKITWRHYQTVPIPQADYDAWYASGGRHVSRPNMGTLTGGLRRLLMIDLDTYKSPKALAWWREVLETENHGIEPETVRQRSGGGGQQLFFQVPADWHCPNAVTDLGVDIRCDGGFAMLPPSLHDSGNSYAWEDGFAPWEVHVDLAGQWLLDAVESLIEAHGHEFRRGADGGRHRRLRKTAASSTNGASSGICVSESCSATSGTRCWNGRGNRRVRGVRCRFRRIGSRGRRKLSRLTSARSILRPKEEDAAGACTERSGATPCGSGARPR